MIIGGWGNKTPIHRQNWLPCECQEVQVNVIWSTGTCYVVGPGYPVICEQSESQNHASLILAPQCLAIHTVNMHRSTAWQFRRLLKLLPTALQQEPAQHALVGRGTCFYPEVRNFHSWGHWIMEAPFLYLYSLAQTKQESFKHNLYLSILSFLF